MISSEVSNIIMGLVEGDGQPGVGGSGANKDGMCMCMGRRRRRIQGRDAT